MDDFLVLLQHYSQHINVDELGQSAFYYFRVNLNLVFNDL